MYIKGHLECINSNKGLFKFQNKKDDKTLDIKNVQFKGNEFICRFNVAKINEGYLEPGAYTLNYITETQTYVAEISNKLLKIKETNLISTIKI